MAHRVKVLATKSDNLNPIPGTYVLGGESQSCPLTSILKYTYISKQVNKQMY